MPKFIILGYGDEDGYRRTARDARDAAHAHDSRLKQRGAVVGMAGRPVQVRNHDAACTKTTSGPYLRSELQIAGFALIEAADLDEAISLVSKTPCAVVHGVVEVWPLNDTP